MSFAHGSIASLSRVAVQFQRSPSTKSSKSPAFTVLLIPMEEARFMGRGSGVSSSDEGGSGGGR